MFKTVSVILVLSFSNLALSYAPDKFIKAKCLTTNPGWTIVAKLEPNIYEVSIQSPFGSGSAALIIPSFPKAKPGKIYDIIYAVWIKDQKMKNNNGFDITVPIFKESSDCKKIWFENVNKENYSEDALKISYPRMPDFEKSIIAKRKGKK
ncbi:MAG: hypothetical protein ACLGHN_10865 [Bacteriovoracia bacterium]